MRLNVPGNITVHISRHIRTLSFRTLIGGVNGGSSAYDVVNTLLDEYSMVEDGDDGYGTVGTVGQKSRNLF